MFYFLLNANASNSRFIIDGNHTDALVPLYNPDSITELLAQYPAVVSGGGPSQSEFDALESDVGDNTTAVAANVTDIAANTSGLGNRLKLDTTQSLTSGTLKLSSNSNQQLILQHTSYADLKLYSNFGQAGIDWKAGTAQVVFDGGRTSINGVMLRQPIVASLPTDPANTCQGCICVVSSNPYKLYFHDSSSWKEIAFV